MVDDGSEDQSWSVIDRYKLAKAYRIQNGGGAKACFFALQRSTAPFILFLDADDALAPGSLDRIIDNLAPGVAKLQFPLWPIDSAGRMLGPAFPRLTAGRDRGTLMHEVLQTGSYQSPPTSGNVFCRPLCSLLADVDYETSVDGVTLFAAPFFGDVVSLSEPLGYYRLHDRNLSQAGSRPTARRFRLEAERFLARNSHLRRVIISQGERADLVDGRRAFFYRERRLYQAILEGQRPRLAEVLALLRLLARSDRAARYRCTLGLFLILCLCLPNRGRQALLGYRVKPERRSALGFLLHLVTA